MCFFNQPSAGAPPKIETPAPPAPPAPAPPAAPVIDSGATPSAALRSRSRGKASLTIPLEAGGGALGNAGGGAGLNIPT